jgi:adenine-specific DNA-methyltransferase
MQNLLEELKKLLEQDERFVVDGKLLKNKIIESALKLDVDLIGLLLKSETIKTHFFQEVDGVLVFDKIKFQKFVSNKAFLPDSYTSFKNKIGLVTENEEYLSESKEVVLAWPYKDCVLEGGMEKEDEKRDEIFYNEILAPDEIDRLLEPKVLTNFERIDKNGEHSMVSLRGSDSDRGNLGFHLDEKGDIKDNLVIKGNNLLALHSLKKRFAGKVKLIYIDPPYNPESKSNTFCYNNSFNESSWLTFMKNRLEVAKTLLKNDGVLIVAIDENEYLQLGVLLKEIFKNYEIHCITIVHNPRGVQGTNFSYTHEYAFFVIPEGKKSVGNRKIDDAEIGWSNLRNWGGESLRTDAKNCFYPIIVENGEVIGFGDVLDVNKHPQSQTEKRDEKFYVYPIDKEGIERKWRYARQSVEEVKHLLKAKKTKGGFEIEIGKDFGTYRTVWIDPKYDANEYGTKLVKSLVPNCKFDFPKSLYNVYDCLYAIVSDDKDAIVLDFFAGSGTTAHAVLELNKEDGGNRQFVLCEQMHYVDTVTKERVKKVIQNNGNGDFVYMELAKLNEKHIDEIKKVKTTKELLYIWKTIKEKTFLSYKVDVKQFDENVKEFEQMSFENQKKFLIECLDKNQLYVNFSEIDDSDYEISEDDKKLNKQFYELK